VASIDQPRAADYAWPLRLERWQPLTAIAFVVFFVASVVVSSPPADDVSNVTWTRAYTGTAHAREHLATGILLVLAALSLLSFLTLLWTRIAAARRPVSVSPLPLIAAGVAAACISVGGVLMASVSGSILIGSMRVPNADELRFANDTGFAMVSVAGMLAAALSIACLSVQARAAGLFGTRMMGFGIVVSIVLLAAVAFLPIAALLIWLVVAAARLMRGTSIETQAAGV
jgi:hypothetical protein